jgi:branched-chain amino acid transport system permease protein
MNDTSTIRRYGPWLLIAAAVLFPLLASALDQGFYIGFMRRVLILALAATSLNFILGYGGMVALGHAGFIGVGAYTVVILFDAGHTSSLLLWPLAMVTAGFAAWVIGAISLRTKGVYFIMITLAFAQMLYFLFVSLRSYGGDDGYTLMARPSLPFGMDAANETTLYWVVLAIVVAVLWLYKRATESHFGHALTGIRDNETRMRALGYPVYRLQVTAFVIAGAVAGLTGAMLASHNSFVSAGVMHWTQSATLIIMVVLGGTGSRWGGVIGAVVWLLLEEILKMSTEYWHLPLGLLLIIIALFAPKGITPFLGGKALARRSAP